MAKVDVLASSKNQRWVTPFAVFDQLHAEFNFAWDCAAEAESAQTVRVGKGQHTYFGPDHPNLDYRDALAVSWVDALKAEGLFVAGLPGLDATSVFVNPPYGRGLGRWFEKFYDESRQLTVVALVYARTETTWFHKYVWSASEVRLLKGRLTFLDPDTLVPAPAGATAGHMVVVWRPEWYGKVGRRPVFSLWDFKEGT